MTDDSNRTLSRRQFAARTAMAALSAAIVPGRVLGGQAPSHKLNIAGIGIGGMGAANLKACENENIIALCDVDQVYSAKTRALYPKAAFYTDYRAMLEKEKGIDAVVIATPDHTHATITMGALQAGKHVVPPEAPDPHRVRGACDHRGRAPLQGRHADGQPGTFLRVDATAEGVAGRRGDRRRDGGPRVDGPASRGRPVVGLRGDGTADRHAAGARNARLGEVARTGGVPAVSPRVSPAEMASLARLRHGPARRHGLPHPRSGILGARARTSAVGRGDVHTLRAGGCVRDVPTGVDRAVRVPGPRQPAPGEAHLVRRAPAAADAAGAGAGPVPARQRRAAHR